MIATVHSRSAPLRPPASSATWLRRPPHRSGRARGSRCSFTSWATRSPRCSSASGSGASAWASARRSGGESSAAVGFIWPSFPFWAPCSSWTRTPTPSGIATSSPAVALRVGASGLAGPDHFRGRRPRQSRRADAAGHLVGCPRPAGPRHVGGRPHACRDGLATSPATSTCCRVSAPTASTCWRTSAPPASTCSLPAPDVRRRGSAEICAPPYLIIIYPAAICRVARVLPLGPPRRPLGSC